ncbi:proteasome assembly chaperone family protein [Natrononativus amylolyticus]|uniref:proteasome assembly chaperone family protein n=1 Tax=Natrononativus amylolyticus TaxID=2963434 RepID=UPI0020CBB59E|nr:PAC2 family protein [Natrononativus amylolyticus]
MSEEVALDIETSEPLQSTLILAFPGPGMAGVSANQYLIEQLELVETGHIQAEGLPSITPYENGRPYHHTRLFSEPEIPCTFLTSELPIPLQLSEPFGRILLEWLDESTVDEVTLLTAIPGLDSNRDLFYVASDDYYDRRLDGTDVSPLKGGFLTGVNASLIARAIDTSLRVGVLSTPVNPRHPLDGEAALRLVNGMNELYDFEADTTQLRDFADRTREHYEQLATRVQAQQQPSGRRPLTEDYGFM